MSKIAVEQLFTELGVKPTISRVGKIEHYSATNIDIFVSDIFNLSGKMIGLIEAIYDRAALVALSEVMRDRYTAHLTEVPDKAPLVSCKRKCLAAKKVVELCHTPLIISPTPKD